jgi:hypothetical protein
MKNKKEHIAFKACQQETTMKIPHLPEEVTWVTPASLRWKHLLIQANKHRVALQKKKKC